MKITRFAVLILIWLSGSVFLQADRGREVTLLFFNDLHGNLQSFTVKNDDGNRVEAGGVARMATLIKKIRRENETIGRKTLLLVAGDILQGTPVSTVFQGRAEVEVLNALKVDAMTIGNHEFDFGLDNFLELQKLARFPFLSSNVLWKDSRNLVGVSHLRVKLSRRLFLTVAGATTRELLTTTNPKNVQRIDVGNAAPAVRLVYDRYGKEGSVIMLSHSRHQSDCETIKAVPELSAVIAGHDHILFDPFRKEGEVPLFQTFEKGRYLGRVDMEVHRHESRARVMRWEYLSVVSSIPADQEIEAVVSQYQGQLRDKFQEVIGEARSFLDAERGRIRFEETNLGDFVADVMREAAGAEIALINAGALRSSIDQGPITMKSVFSAVPYPNEILLMRLSGETLEKILHRAVQGSRDEEDGGFLHVSGLRFVISGKTVKTVTVNGVPLEPKKIYTVAVTDFMASGGDGYDMLPGEKAENTGLPLREVLGDVIRSRKVIDAAVDGRILRAENKKDQSSDF